MKNPHGIMRYINRISHSNAIVYGEKLKDYGLTQCQHPYIRYICREPGVSQEQLAKLLCVNPSSVTRQLAILEKKELITRTQDEEDRRVWRVYPTEKMKQLFPYVQQIMKQWNEYLLQDLSLEEREQLFSMLDRMMSRAVSAAEEKLGGK